MRATALSAPTIVACENPQGVHMTITVRTNGGSVVMELLHNPATDDWVPAEVFTEDGAHTVRPGLFTVRLTGNDGATFNFSRG